MFLIIPNLIIRWNMVQLDYVLYFTDGSRDALITQF